MKLADLLGTVSNVPLTQFPWAPPLLSVLNDGVQEHMKLTLDLTGQEVIARLFARGASSSTLLNAEFDLATGLLNTAPEPAPQAVAPTVAVPVVAVNPAVPVPATQWSANKVIGFAGAGLIVLLSLVMVFMSFTGKGVSPEQARVVEKAIDVLGDVTNKAMDDERRTQPATQPSQQPQQLSPFDTNQPGSQPYTFPQQQYPQ